MSARCRSRTSPRPTTQIHGIRVLLQQIHRHARVQRHPGHFLTHLRHDLEGLCGAVQGRGWYWLHPASTKGGRIVGADDGPVKALGAFLVGGCPSSSCQSTRQPLGWLAPIEGLCGKHQGTDEILDHLYEECQSAIAIHEDDGEAPLKPCSMKLNAEALLDHGVRPTCNTHEAVEPVVAFCHRAGRGCPMFGHQRRCCQSGCQTKPPRGCPLAPNSGTCLDTWLKSRGTGAPQPCRGPCRWSPTCK